MTQIIKETQVAVMTRGQQLDDEGRHLEAWLGSVWCYERLRGNLHVLACPDSHNVSVSSFLFSWTQEGLLLNEDLRTSLRRQENSWVSCPVSEKVRGRLWRCPSFCSFSDAKEQPVHTQYFSELTDLVIIWSQSCFEIQWLTSQDHI